MSNKTVDEVAVTNNITYLGRIEGIEMEDWTKLDES
jgi:hypothetical protein